MSRVPLSVLLRGAPAQSLERPNKVAVVVKTNGLCNVAHGPIGLFQVLDGSINPGS